MAPDQPVRQQALDIRESFIVQAPAGSGKTELLIQRYLNLLAHVDEPEEILAITFTRKAAAEMHHRVVSALQSVQHSDGTPTTEPDTQHERLTWQLANEAMTRSRQRQWKLEAQPVRLRIMTIDALNTTLVRRMPWLSRTGGDVMIHDQPDRLYEEAAWNTLDIMNASVETQQALSALLLHLDNDDRRVVRLLVDMLKRRDHWLDHLVPLKSESQVREQLTKMFEQVIEDQLQLIHAQLPAHLADEMARLAAIGAQRLYEQGELHKTQVVLRDIDSVPPPDFAAIVHWKALANLYLTQQGTWRSAKSFNKTLGFPPGCEEKAAIGDLCQRLLEEDELLQGLAVMQYMPELIYEDRQWQLLEALVELLPVAVANLQLVFQQHSAMDFVEQALAAQRALGDENQVTDLSLKLDYQLRHILMDEFQDTSHSQFRLLEKLIAGWQADDGRSLFLVGDPMQSIYGFREADVSGYLRVRDHGIGPIKPHTLVLEANFRSTPELMQWFNSVFPDVLAGEDDLALGAVSYTPAIAARGSHPASKVTVHAGLGRDSHTEAKLIVEQIQQAIKDDPGQTIGVLVRSRGHLHDLFPLLVEAQIDFQAVDILPLRSEAVIQDLLSVTRTLLHRHDRIAWLAVLRAPWCGLTLQSMHIIAAEHPKADLWGLMNDESIQRLLEDDERQRLLRVVECYVHILGQGAKLSLRTRVDWLWQALGGADCHAHPQAIEDAAAYLDMLDGLEQAASAGGQAVTLNNIRITLKDCFSSGASHAGARVQLMTIHKSKGLEFDTVILPSLERGTGKDNKKLLVWHEELGTDFTKRLLLAPIHSPGSNDRSYDFVRAREQRRRAYEDQRLLYVAITRARQHLHLFGSLKRTRDGEPGNAAKGSFLSLLEPHVREDFLNLLTPVTEDESLVEEIRPATLSLKRVPTNWHPVYQGKNIDWQPAEEPPVEVERIEFSWAGQAARIIGTVTHQYLHLLAQHDHDPGLGIEAWDENRIEQQRPTIAASLVSEGLPLDAMDDAVLKVMRALTNVVQDQRAQWILKDHKDSKSEYAISGVVDGRIINRVIDRTFIDETGIRWIIDYKTSLHEGGNLEGFLDREQTRYAAQLNEYAALLGQLGDEPISLGLYFPLMNGWRAFGPR